MASSDYVCPRCGNRDPASIGYLNGQPYCRLCLPFKGDIVTRKNSSRQKPYEYFLSYSLQEEQQEVSDAVVENFKNGVNTLIDAVCGAGKTEIILEVISYALRHNMTVGFAIPRRDVVIEICERLTTIFKKNTVVSVYGGHNDVLEGDIICLTTHQLYRYPKYFDLLIMDEIDAFPYQNNKVLSTFFEQSVCGNYVLMSATPNEELIKHFSEPGYEVLSLNKRFHGHKLPVPIIKIRQEPLMTMGIMKLLSRYIKEGKQVFIFCPTIDLCESLYKRISLVIKGGNYVHSKRVNREKIISDFKFKKYTYLVTTQVLERGVTVDNLQIIVAHADHKIYEESTLVQISGRAGRKAKHPEGDVYFFASEKTETMVNAIRRIEDKNKDM
ncbi:MAG: DEAD/DEAH box helicase family protein [Coprobacillus sp.]|nr:DEAD/DEAH box helicase family protein [Coprobacillus sp.]